MGPRFKNRFALAGVALAAAAFAGGAYAATQAGSDSRKAFIDDVAHRLNVSPARLKSALKSALIDRINAAVKEGRLTQARANAIEQRINQGEVPLSFGQHHGFGHGGLFLGHRHGPLSAAATYLGVTEPQLMQQLANGKSLAQVAQSKGKTTAGLEQAMTAAFTARLDKAVSAGRINKQQEQTILGRFHSRLGSVVNRSGPRFGGLHAMPDHPGAPPGGAPGSFEGPGGAPGSFEGPGGAPGSFEAPPPPPPPAA